jgi:hypothetical protein
MLQGRTHFMSMEVCSEDLDARLTILFNEIEPKRIRREIRSADINRKLWLVCEKSVLYARCQKRFQGR